MLSKEEILGRPEFLPRDNVPDYLRTMYDPKKVLAAMDEYAKQEAIEFAKWVEENCQIIREQDITLYRYNDSRHDGWGNYILEDIYSVFKEFDHAK